MNLDQRLFCYACPFLAPVPRSGTSATQWYVCHKVVRHLTRLILHRPGVVLEHFSLGSGCAVPVVQGRAKEPPVFFPTHYSFRGKCAKRYFNSKRVLLQLDEGNSLCLSPGFIRSLFVFFSETKLVPVGDIVSVQYPQGYITMAPAYTIHLKGSARAAYSISCASKEPPGMLDFPKYLDSFTNLY